MRLILINFLLQSWLCDVYCHLFFGVGLLYYRNTENPTAIEEAKEYFHRAIHNGKQLESYHKLAEIYKSSNNFPKAIEMLESTLP